MLLKLYWQNWNHLTWLNNPDSKVHMANMGLTWVLSAPGGSHIGPINFAIREHFEARLNPDSMI